MTRTIPLVLIAACNAAPEPPATATGRYLEVRLARGNGDIAVASSRAIDSPFELAPQLGGDHVLVGSVGGQAVYAQPFAFPTEIAFENGVTVETVEIPDPWVVLHVPLDQPLDRLAWADASGVLHDLGPPVTTEARRVADLQDNVVPNAPQIRFLDAADLEPLIPSVAAPHVAMAVDVSAITPQQLQGIIAEIDDDAIGLRSAITDVGFAKLVDPGMYGFAVGSLLVLSVDRIDAPGFPGTITHEGAHCYTNALSSPSETFPDELAALIDDTISSHLLGRQFVDLWAQLHESGADFGLSGAYVGADWMSVTDPLSQGFVRAYGSYSPKEDIATYVEGAVTGSLGGDSACVAMRATGGSLTQALAIPYAKIELLHHTGFLTDDQVAACTGGASFTGNVGMFFNTNGGSAELSCGSVEGGWLDEDGAQFLAVVSTSCENNYVASVRVLAPDHVPPLGMHRLDAIWSSNLNLPNNALLLGNSNSNLERVSRSGLVLVSRADAHRIEGVMFFVAIGSDLVPITEVFPVSTFRFDS